MKTRLLAIAFSLVIGAQLAAAPGVHTHAVNFEVSEPRVDSGSPEPQGSTPRAHDDRPCDACRSRAESQLSPGSAASLVLATSTCTDELDPDHPLITAVAAAVDATRVD